jgi:hypothetical protein
MKTFYEMIQILEGRSWMDIANSGPSHWDDPNDKPAPSFSKELIGPENQPPTPFYANINVEEGYWTCDAFFAYDYKLNGSENPASEPVQESDGVMFKKPGRRLELLPSEMRGEAIQWVQRQVDWWVKNYDRIERDREESDNAKDRYDDRGY